MSKWTHVLGVVRFDSMNLNVYPEPFNKDLLVKAEAQIVHESFFLQIPSGSEGPLEIKTSLTGRGPTVQITGDLRDFGSGDIEKIKDWINKSIESVDSLMEKIDNSRFPLFLRDACVICNVEFDDNLYLLEIDNEVLTRVEWRKIQ